MQQAPEAMTLKVIAHLHTAFPTTFGIPRQSGLVEELRGEIAAVRVGEEATLKHFHRQGDAVMLLADNAAVCPPMFYAGEQLSELHIEGKAVGLCRGL